MALDALVSAVPPEMVATVADKKSAKEAWDVIATMRVGDDRVRKAAAQQLRSQFDRATFGEGESVEDFALRLNGMVATLATLGENVEEYVIVEKILRCVPPRLKQIALSISTLLDVRSLTVSNLAGRLRAVEEAFEEPPAMLQQDGKVYFTEEWIARRARRDAENPGSGGSGGSGSNTGGNGGRGGSDRGRGRGRGRGGGRGPQKTDECRRCGKLGHWARECQSKAKKEQAHFAQDEEAVLMVVRATLTRGAAAVSGTDVAAAAPRGDAAGGVVAAVSDCGAVAAASGGDLDRRHRRDEPYDRFPRGVHRSGHVVSI
jgi:hypothetical protein